MKFHNFSMFSQKIYIYLQLSAEKNWIYLQEHQILQFLNNFWTFCQKKILNKFTNKTTQKFYTKMITSFIFISNKNFKFCNFLPKNLNLSLKTSIFHNFWTKFWTFCQTPGDLWQKHVIEKIHIHKNFLKFHSFQWEIHKIFWYSAIVKHSQKHEILLFLNKFRPHLNLSLLIHKL